MSQYKDYGFGHAGAGHMHGRLVPHLLRMAGELGPGVRVLDVGCGNGYVAGKFLERGCAVTGVDLSRSGIELARKTCPQGRFEIMAADNNLLGNLNEEPFNVIVSTEVVEHLYSPRDYARGCFEALKPGGRFLCSTPYHGYLKNFTLSLLNKWDSHANPLWDGGHIKLWSRKTLTLLLKEVGFRDFRFQGVGRAPWLWMTMIVSATK